MFVGYNFLLEVYRYIVHKIVYSIVVDMIIMMMINDNGGTDEDWHCHAIQLIE